MATKSTNEEKGSTTIRISKNTKVDQLSQFEYTISEILDTKKYKAYGVSITIERI